MIERLEVALTPWKNAFCFDQPATQDQMSSTQSTANPGTSSESELENLNFLVRYENRLWSSGRQHLKPAQPKVVKIVFAVSSKKNSMIVYIGGC